MKTSQRQIFQNGGDGLTSSQEDSPASRSVLPDEEGERRMTATSGRRCCVLCVKSGPLGSLARTLLESSRRFSPARRLKWEAVALCSEKLTEKEYCYGRNTLSKPSAVTLSEKVTKSSRLLFRLVPSERPTAGTGCGLLPTVQTQGLKVNVDGKTEFMLVDLLPTPNAAEGEKYSTKYNPDSQMGKGLTAMALNGLIPTPTASCHNAGTPTDMKNGRTRDSFLNHMVAKQCGKTSRLNPLFVAEMMGFPPDWTVLPFLNGDRNP